MIEVLDSPEPHNESNKRSLRDLIDNGYKFDFGKYIENAFNVWKEDIVGFSLYSLLMMVIIFVSIFTLVGPIFLGGPLTAGYYIVAGKIKRNEPHEFGDFFKGFDKFKDLLIMTLILIGFSLLAAILLIPSAIFEELFIPLSLLFSFLFYVATYYISTIYIFAIPFIVFGNLSAWTAMEASRKIIHKNFWWFLLLLIVSSMIAFIGIIAFFIGLFVTMSLQQIIYFAAYEEIIGLASRKDEAQEVR